MESRRQGTTTPETNTAPAGEKSLAEWLNLGGSCYSWRRDNSVLHCYNTFSLHSTFVMDIIILILEITDGGIQAEKDGMHYVASKNKTFLSFSLGRRRLADQVTSLSSSSPIRDFVSKNTVTLFQNKRLCFKKQGGFLSKQETLFQKKANS